LEEISSVNESKSLENQFIYPIPKGSKLIFFAPLGVGVNEENQFAELGAVSYLVDVKMLSTNYRLIASAATLCLCVFVATHLSLLRNLEI